MLAVQFSRTHNKVRHITGVDSIASRTTNHNMPHGSSVLYRPTQRTSVVGPIRIPNHTHTHTHTHTYIYIYIYTMQLQKVLHHLIWVGMHPK